jgi:hypothetical protein
MPTVALASSTLMLTDAGWARLADLRPRCVCWGIDGHGQAAKLPIEVTASGETEQMAFLGTTRSFGFFVEGSELRDANGRRVPLGDVITSGIITSHRFEQALTLPAGPLGTDAVWEDLQQLAAEAKPAQVALRCRTRASERPFSGGQVGIFTARGQRMYYLLARERLNAHTDASVRLFEDLIQVFTTDDGRIELSRDQPALALFLCGMLCHLDRQYSLEYDTVQHSKLVHCRLDATAQLAVGAGRSAQLVARRANLLRVAWSSAAWTLLANGMLLA